MRKSVFVPTLITAIVLLIINIFQFCWWRKINKDQAEEYLQQVAALNATIAKYGDDVTIYTVNRAVKAGDEVKLEDLKEAKCYSSLLTDQYVPDTSDRDGRYYK